MPGDINNSSPPPCMHSSPTEAGGAAGATRRSNIIAEVVELCNRETLGTQLVGCVSVLHVAPHVPLNQLFVPAKGFPEHDRQRMREALREESSSASRSNRTRQNSCSGLSTGTPVLETSDHALEGFLEKKNGHFLRIAGLRRSACMYEEQEDGSAIADGTIAAKPRRTLEHSWPAIAQLHAGVIELDTRVGATMGLLQRWGTVVLGLVHHTAITEPVRAPVAIDKPIRVEISRETPFPIGEM